MQTKLTLKLNKDAIASAKRYAARSRQSLSSIVEGYFRSLPRREQNESLKRTPIVNSLSGMIKGPRERDTKAEYSQYLERKYKR
jgi:hypothetical protein